MSLGSVAWILARPAALEFDMLAKHGDDNDWLVCAVYQDGMYLYIEDLPETVPQALRDIRHWLNTHSRLGWVRLDEQFDTVEGLAIYDQR